MKVDGERKRKREKKECIGLGALCCAGKRGCVFFVRAGARARRRGERERARKRERWRFFVTEKEKEIEVALTCFLLSLGLRFF